MLAAMHILERLVSSGRSRHWLAQQTGISFATLNRRLMGHSDFTLLELELIAKSLGISLSCLIFTQGTRMAQHVFHWLVSGVTDLTVTEIRQRALDLGMTPGQLWDRIIYPSLSASSRTEPGETPNSAQSWCK